MIEKEDSRSDVGKRVDSERRRGEGLQREGFWVQSPASHPTIQTSLNTPETGELLLQGGPLGVVHVTRAFHLNTHA